MLSEWLWIDYSLILGRFYFRWHEIKRMLYIHLIWHMTQPTDLKMTNICSSIINKMVNFIFLNLKSLNFMMHTKSEFLFWKLLCLCILLAFLKQTKYIIYLPFSSVSWFHLFIHKSLKNYCLNDCWNFFISLPIWSKYLKLKNCIDHFFCAVITFILNTS